MRNIACAVLITIALPLSATTTANNDSCDIGTYPAATLLVPYFEVFLGPAGSGTTTIFSVTNVSANPQIARVTLWTDWAFPVLSFNIFLTGYDVQPINLYDVVARGLIAGTQGTSTGSPNPQNNPTLGSTPLTNLANPNFAADVPAQCAPGRLPGILPVSLSTDIRAMLSAGRSTGNLIGCKSGGVEQQIGGNHGGNVAIGYATIDLVNTCAPFMPSDAGYWGEMLYDNVLTGDYQQVVNSPTTGNYAGGNPMVHIRAVSGLPYTFYDRFTKADRRQPLPSTFAARWISGSGAGFDTAYKIWREAATAATATCDQYAANSAVAFGEIVRFDERENAGVIPCQTICAEPPANARNLPVASRMAVTMSVFPTVAGSTDVGGWTYFNLNSGANASRASQNWVTVSMFAEGRFGVEQDATLLGNGCSPAAALSGATHIGPRP